MQRMKKTMAVALAATMVVGSGITAAAAETATSGSSTGAGTSEGHLDTHVISVTLPTVADGATPFAYTMDLERLIQDTAGGKYTDSEFPEKANDTGVYFKTVAEGKTVYKNESEALKVTSESSADVELTVEVAASKGATDIPLVAAKPADEVTDAQLYLGLKVGSETDVAIKSGETITKTVTIQGKDDNFEKKVEGGKYVYAPKTGGTLTWNEVTFSVEGAASKASAENLTAPTLTVTWKYVDPAATPVAPTAPTEATYSLKNGSEIAIDLGKGNLGATGVASIKAKNTEDGSLYDATGASFADGKLTIAATQWPKATAGQKRWVVVTFNDTNKTTKTIVVTVEE